MHSTEDHLYCGCRLPLPDASPEDWAEFVGVPHDTPKPVSFVMLADPRFSQVRSARCSAALLALHTAVWRRDGTLSGITAVLVGKQVYNTHP
jgi:hypothetical protein